MPVQATSFPNKSRPQPEQNTQVFEATADRERPAHLYGYCGLLQANKSSLLLQRPPITPRKHPKRKFPH